MAELVRSFIARLKADDPTLKDDLRMISHLLRKAWSGSVHSGVTEIDAEEISSDEAMELREALLDAFHRASNESDARPLLHALAFAHEKSIQEHLVTELRLALEIHRAASARLWGALLSLDDVGEPVFDRSELSQSIDYVEMNIRVANRYLRNRGILVPL
jgi:hypothetical protein